VSQITILLLYLLAAAAFTLSRLPRFEQQSRPYLLLAYAFGLIAVVLHAQHLFALILPGDGFHLSIETTLRVELLGLHSILCLLVFFWPEGQWDWRSSLYAWFDRRSQPTGASSSPK